MNDCRLSETDCLANRGNSAATETSSDHPTNALGCHLLDGSTFHNASARSAPRERLYVSDDPDMTMAGLLLYTASGDSEGTLGGLVHQGEPDRAHGTVRGCIRNAAICSSDPLCIESSGQGLFSLNLSACHACSLLPETSCEVSLRSGPRRVRSVLSCSDGDRHRQD
jgi:hypothetical protein